MGYPVNGDIKLDDFYEWYLQNGLDHVQLNNAGDPNESASTNHGALEVEREVILSYLNGSMPMINCSRSATNPLKFYWLSKTKGVDGFSAQAKTLLENAAYLKGKLDEIGWPAWMSCEQSNTVFFKRPSDATMEKYFLAPDHDDRFGGDLAHATVMQNANRDLVDKLVEDLKAEMQSTSGQVKEAA